MIPDIGVQQLPKDALRLLYTKDLNPNFLVFGKSRQKIHDVVKIVANLSVIQMLI